MKAPSVAALIALSSLPLLCSSWPLLPKARNAQHLNPRRPATYSVVPVDGGSISTPPATETVTQPITQTVLSTLVSTLVLTELETPTTILITLTSTTIFETPSAAASPTLSPSSDGASPTFAASSQQTAASQTFAVSAASFSPPSTTSIFALVPLPTAIPETVTVTVPAVAPSSVPYDNGMWHTTYYHAVSADYEAPVSSAAASLTTDIADFLYTSATSATSIPTLAPSSAAYPTWNGFGNCTTNGTTFARAKLNRLR